jgi:hypothetical protein
MSKSVMGIVIPLLRSVRDSLPASIQIAFVTS